MFFFLTIYLSLLAGNVCPRLSLILTMRVKLKCLPISFVKCSLGPLSPLLGIMLSMTCLSCLK